MYTPTRNSQSLKVRESSSILISHILPMVACLMWISLHSWPWKHWSIAGCKGFETGVSTTPGYSWSQIAEQSVGDTFTSLPILREKKFTDECCYFVPPQVTAMLFSHHSSRFTFCFAFALLESDCQYIFPAGILSSFLILFCFASKCPNLFLILNYSW